ncbi:hypothetical protein SteCoe_12026 [Stentor coeruleus]|uniref:SMP-LTD domain-containing protein n=1 Tax=Stentor coeruleus TaxID=5963 RepID=A0A1R2CBS3_9CILI|nr:hypothetical protein SteCoe_12026 [Stentor coeruleus]
MDSLASKFGIFISGVVLAKFIPSSFISLLVFALGILLTLIIEIICFIYYVGIASDEYIPNIQGQIKHSNEDCENFSRPFARSPKKIQMSKFPLERRFTMMQCLCNGSKFMLLHSTSDTTLNDLSGILKEFLTIDKKYANGLVKLGEISILEKIKSKKSMVQLKHFREFCFEIGKKYLKDNEDVMENLIQDVNAINKETVKKYKELIIRYQNAGEKFYSYTSDIQKLSEKLLDLQNSFKKANSDFSEARKDLAQFETLVKKEMKLKKINNEVGTIKSQISKLMEHMHEESKSFAPRATDIMKDLSLLEKFIGQRYKSYIDTWLSYITHLIDFSLEKIQILPIESYNQRTSENRPSLKRTVTFLKNTLSKSEIAPETPRFKSFFSSFSSADNQNSAFKHIEKKIDKLEDYTTDIIKFFTNLMSIDEDMNKEWLRIINSWVNVENVYIDDPLNEVKNSIADMKNCGKDLRAEIFACVAKCKDFLGLMGNFRREALQYDSSAEDNSQAMEKIKDLNDEYRKIVDEVKNRVVLALRVMFENSRNEMRKIVESFEIMEDGIENLNFNHAAKLHRPKCPYYVVNVEDNEHESSFVKEPEKVGDPESAVWLNDLLDAFLSEWRYSPRFISYICRRLKKIYNKDNPDYIGEIEVKDVEIGDEAPEIRDFTQLETDNDLEFFYDFELWFRGDVKIHLEFELKWSVASLPVNVKVVLRSFYCKLRFFYAPSQTKCSWYSFISEPVHQITIEPVIGKMSKIALSKIPQINTLLVNALSRKIRKYVWPNKRSIKIYKGNKSDFPLE